MKTPGLLLAVLTAALLATCSSPFGNKLSFAQMQSINRGVPAGWVLEEYPFGKVARTADGKVQSISYTVQDPRASSQSLRLEFDQRELLCRKVYSGPVVRPGGSHAKPPK